MPELPLTAEIIGPAGAGKSTLFRELKMRRPEALPEIPISRLDCLPFFIRNTARFLPDFLVLPAKGRRLTWRENRAMVYVDAWRRTLLRQDQAFDRMFFLDHGPIFRLVTLREFGPEFTSRAEFHRWWDDSLTNWCSMIGTLIWLDAPPLLLAHRIAGRPTRHRMKGRTAAEIQNFIVRYQNCFEQVVSLLRGRSRVRVLRYDTSRLTPAEIAEAVLSA